MGGGEWWVGRLSPCNVGEHKPGANRSGPDGGDPWAPAAVRPRVWRPPHSRRRMSFTRAPPTMTRAGTLGWGGWGRMLPEVLRWPRVEGGDQHHRARSRVVGLFQRCMRSVVVTDAGQQPAGCFMPHPPTHPPNPPHPTPATPPPPPSHPHPSPGALQGPGAEGVWMRICSLGPWPQRNTSPSSRRAQQWRFPHCSSAKLGAGPP